MSSKMNQGSKKNPNNSKGKNTKPASTRTKQPSDYRKDCERVARTPVRKQNKPKK